MAKDSYTHVIQKFEKKLDTLFTSLLGIPETEDNGFIGEMGQDIKDVKQHLKVLNNSVADNTTTGAKNSTSIGRLYWIVGGVCLLFVTAAGIIVAVVV